MRAAGKEARLLIGEFTFLGRDRVSRFRLHSKCAAEIGFEMDARSRARARARAV